MTLAKKIQECRGHTLKTEGIFEEKMKEIQRIPKILFRIRRSAYGEAPTLSYPEKPGWIRTWDYDITQDKYITYTIHPYHDDDVSGEIRDIKSLNKDEAIKLIRRDLPLIEKEIKKEDKER